MHRRDLLIASISVLVTGTAGCTGDEDRTGNGGESGDGGDDAQNTADGGIETQDNGDGGDGSGSKGSSGSDTTPSVEQVAVSGEDYTQTQAVNTLNFNYATQTVAKLRSPDGAAREPDSGNKFVVLHGKVTFESKLDEQVDVYAGSATGLSANGIIYEGVTILDLPDLKRTARPGATYDGWLAYEVPQEVTQAKLVGNDVDLWFDNRTEIFFEQDSALSADQYEAKS